MYNNSSETIPLKTPVHLQVFLRPWFDNNCLQEGLDLIREKTIQHFFFYRHIGSALLENSKAVSIVFAATGNIKQGFTLKEHSCTFCGQRAAKKYCPHLAALTILSLTTRDGDERNLFPIPLHFKQSGWYQIGSFLYSWLSRQSGNTLSDTNDTVFQLKKETGQGGIAVELPLHMAAQWNSFFLFGNNSPTDTEKTLATLRENIKKQSLTAAERQMLSMNSETRGSKCDASVWLWLCRYFALQENGNLPILAYDDDREMLALKTELDDAAFILHLPKNRTWELLSSLRGYGLDLNILPPAQECFQVYFLPSGAIQVVLSLRLSDNNLVPCNTLEKQKMGSHYFLPDEGFLPVKKLDQTGVITHPDNSGQLNLFDFAQRSQEQEKTFIVETNRIHAFLEHNRDALKHPDNSVDQDILEITTTLLPQELIIDKFSEDNDWCYLSCHYGMGDASISLDDILEAATAKSDYIPGQEWLQLSDSPLSWLYDLLPERLTRSENGTESVLRLRHSELMALTGLVPEVRNNVSKKDFRKQLSELLDCNSWSDDSLLHDCPDHLRDYQRTGMAWLSSLYRFGLGGLLADDMGLGKTHQGLALLDSIQKQKQPEQSAQLIICPASVLFHWKNKIDEFYPQISYTIYYGPDRILDTTINPGLLITTYTIARIDKDRLAAIPFDIVLLDEIQNLKNHKTAIHKTVAMLSARVKIGLTGTPIENSLIDLHSLFSICLPGFFGSTKNFTNHFLIPINENKNKEVEERLRRLIHPFILRRDRKQVLTELPDLAIDDRTCELSDTQIKLYREIVDESQELLEDIELEGASVKYINILAMLTRLKQVCNHPSLLEKSIDAEQYESGKWNLFVELLSECLAADRKIVIFSQYTGMLDIIEHYLKQTGIDFASLRGNMPVTRREKMLKKFNDEKECKVFCASLLAGGTGIDLVAAQVVIHYDRWWNPAKEAQATARVHRMGQKQQVQVFRLITVGTLEEKIHLLLKRKQEMSDSLIGTDESGVIKKLDHSQLKELFRLDR